MNRNTIWLMFFPVLIHALLRPINSQLCSFKTCRKNLGMVKGQELICGVAGTQSLSPLTHWFQRWYGFRKIGEVLSVKPEVFKKIEACFADIISGTQRGFLIADRFFSLPDSMRWSRSIAAREAWAFHVRPRFPWWYVVVACSLKGMDSFRL